MAARLRSIESAISSLQLSGLSSGSSSSRHGTVGTLSHPSASPEDGPSPRGTGSDPGGEAGQGAAAKQTDMGETAVQAINDAVDLLHQVTSSIPGLAAFQSHEAGEGVSEAEQEQGRTSASNKYEDGLIERILQSEAWVRPDVLDRGVMTIDEVDKTFEMCVLLGSVKRPREPAIDVLFVGEAFSPDSPHGRPSSPPSRRPHAPSPSPTRPSPSAPARPSSSTPSSSRRRTSCCHRLESGANACTSG